DYKDLQVSRFTGTAVILQNAASARVKGIDADLTWAVTPQFSLTAAAEYLDGKYRKFPDAAVTIPTGTGNINGVFNASGKRMTRSPKFTATLSGDYHIDTSLGRFAAYAS